MTPRSRGQLRGAILRWYLKHRRDLPWRRTRDPYAIWVSEIMLQQTRVETVVPYYDRFLRRFPSIASLARAGASEVLAAWSGLGYYRRARNLHDAAALLVREHGGRVPSDTAALRRLPGVGDYTAAAIASVAFGRASAAVDGNVIRVLARIHGLKGSRDSSKLRRSVIRLAEALAAGLRPGDWTQALMELGATVCLPREPGCARCPARAACAARASGEPDRYPEAGGAPSPKRGRRVLLVARRRGRIFLVPDLAEAGGVWTLPTSAASGRGERAAEALARGLGPGRLRGPIATFRHRTYAEDLDFEVWESELTPGTRPRGSGRRVLAAAGGHRLPAGKWVSPAGLQKLPVRAPTLKAIKGLRG